MTAEALHDLAEEMLARELAERVIHKLLERQKRALVVYTGSNMGAADALDSMRKLRSEGFTFRVLMSRSAAGLLDTDAIRTALEPEEFWVDRPAESPEALTARYDTIIVPALTVNTAAHVAACMADAPSAAVILDGLMRGKNVVMAIDGCCPDNEERTARGFHMAEPLKQRLRDHMETLRSYGARLTTSDRLCEKTLRAVGSVFAPAAARQTEQRGPTVPAKQATPAVLVPPAPQIPRFSGKVLSGRHIQNWPPHTELRVPKGTLVTQMAQDEARRRDVRIAEET